MRHHKTLRDIVRKCEIYYETGEEDLSKGFMKAGKVAQDAARDGGKGCGVIKKYFVHGRLW